MNSTVFFVEEHGVHMWCTRYVFLHEDETILNGNIPIVAENYITNLRDRQSTSPFYCHVVDKADKS